MSEWTKVNLGMLAEYLNGAAFKPSDWSQDGTPIIRIQNLTNPEKPLNRTHKKVADKILVQPGDILVSWSATLDTFIWEGEVAWLNQHIFRVLPNIKIISKDFLFYVLKREVLQLSTTEHLHGSTMKHINRGPFLAHEILLPPLEEQGRIVGSMQRLNGCSMRAKNELRKISKLVKKYREAILSAAFRGELTRDWRNNSLNASKEQSISSVLAEKEAERKKRGLRLKGKNRSVTGRKHELPLIPNDWSWTTFEDVSFDITVGHVGSMKERYVQEGIPFLRSLNVRPNSINFESKIVFIDEKFHEELAKSKLSPGDLVIVRTGEPGIAAVVPNNLPRANCSDLVIARLVPSINPHYAAYYMNSDFAQTFVRDAQVGVAQRHFNVGSMSEMPFPYAPISEQDEIVRKIEAAFDWLDRIVKEQERTLKLLPLLDQAILAKALDGDLSQAA